MSARGLFRSVAACGLLLIAAAARGADDATLFRVFLKDGSSLVSYGELARVDSRVVFSMPTASDGPAPQLHLVNIDAAHVDWDRTSRYAESARAQRYLETRAEGDYAALTAQVARVLDDVGSTNDATRRLAIVEEARKTLADWPPRHYNYRQTEVREMLALLDEAIADLRAAAGLDRFSLNLVAPSDVPVTPEPVPMLPLPTPKEAIEQVLVAARYSATPVDRTSLLTAAVGAIDRAADRLPAEWAADVRARALHELAEERAADRAYDALTTRMLGVATRRARAADVRGVQRVLDDIAAEDRNLGGRRPDAVSALVAAVEEELDAARRLRLARDRWTLRLDDVRRYDEAMTVTMQQFDRLRTALEDIRALAGPAVSILNEVQRAAGELLKAHALITPPFELKSAHALIASAASLADTAARVRRTAIMSGDMAQAWDASSAAAGALMLAARAREEIQAALKPPQLPR